MALVNLSRDVYADAITGGASYTRFNNANAHLGVGDNNPAQAWAAGQTDLQGGNKSRKPMDVGYPTRTANVIVWRATWPTADGNFAWAERGVFNAAAAGTMLSRKVVALGTKTNANSWQLTCTDTLAI